MMPVDRPFALTPKQLLEDWSPVRVGRRLILESQVDSTNDVALNAANESDADGLVVMTDFQRTGRGRFGRVWSSPRGASVLYTALIVEPDRHRVASTGDGPTAVGPDSECIGPGDDPVETAGIGGRLTLVAAVAAAEGIRAATDITPVIKWPNDLRARGRKLGGILIETRPIGSDERAWVVGVGINCLQQAGHFPDEVQETATSLDLLSSNPIDRAVVAREQLKAMDRWLSRSDWRCGNAVYEAWTAYAEPIGQRVRLRYKGDDTYEGHTVAVDPAGGLIVHCDDNQRRWFDPLLTTLL
jgi:BirA family biotin operon repressor/biotin-[acetyl-CoA-carboxylase] ligase